MLTLLTAMLVMADSDHGQMRYRFGLGLGVGVYAVSGPAESIGAEGTLGLEARVGAVFTPHFAAALEVSLMGWPHASVVGSAAAVAEATILQWLQVAIGPGVFGGLARVRKAAEGVVGPSFELRLRWLLNAPADWDSGRPPTRDTFALGVVFRPAYVAGTVLTNFAVTLSSEFY